MDSYTALLVQRRKKNEPDLLEEFEALATTAGYSVIGRFDVLGPPTSKFGIRKGKVEEITTWIEINSPEFALISPQINSSQMFRLMEEWEIEVRDRTQVILEIFDRHAKTPQAKLQIEQARLSYELPFERHQIRKRLQKEHTGDRPVAEQIGAGEDLLNLRIKELRRRLATIKSKLEKISQSQRLLKKRRTAEGFLEITLAGYTNAGKSTLHQALTDSDVEVADQLFTTLSTKAATLPLPGRQVVLSDSVGFISDLPPILLQAFNTTLMEISDADVILLVIDGSDEKVEMLRKTEACIHTFSEIGVNGISMVVALNKIDLLTEDEIAEREILLQEYSDTVLPISAADRTNIELVLHAVDEKLPRLQRYSVTIPYGDEGMSLLSWLYTVGEIESRTYSDGVIELEVNLSTDVAQKLLTLNQDGSMKRLNGK